MAEEEEIFEVEAILGHEERNGVILFHIRWRGYGPEFDTLEPIENLSGCELLLNDYLSHTNLRQEGASVVTDEFDFSESNSSSSSDVELVLKKKKQTKKKKEDSRKDKARAALIAREEKKKEKKKAVEKTKKTKKEKVEPKVVVVEKPKKPKVVEKVVEKPKVQEAPKKVVEKPESPKKQRAKSRLREPKLPSESAGFEVDFAFRDTDVFRAADVASLTPQVEHAHAMLESRLANPFPIKRMNRIKKVGQAVQVECELPDNPNSVWLPFSLLQIVQPQALAKFLIETQAYLCEPTSE